MLPWLGPLESGRNEGIGLFAHLKSIVHADSCTELDIARRLTTLSSFLLFCPKLKMQLSHHQHQVKAISRQCSLRVTVWEYYMKSDRHCCSDGPSFHSLMPTSCHRSTRAWKTYAAYGPDTNLFHAIATPSFWMHKIFTNCKFIWKIKASQIKYELQPSDSTCRLHNQRLGTSRKLRLGCVNIFRAANIDTFQ